MKAAGCILIPPLDWLVADRNYGYLFIADSGDNSIALADTISFFYAGRDQWDQRHSPWDNSTPQLILPQITAHSMWPIPEITACRFLILLKAILQCHLFRVFSFVERIGFEFILNPLPA